MERRVLRRGPDRDDGRKAVAVVSAARGAPEPEAAPPSKRSRLSPAAAAAAAAASSSSSSSSSFSSPRGANRASLLPAALSPSPPPAAAPVRDAAGARRLLLRTLMCVGAKKESECCELLRDALGSDAVGERELQTELTALNDELRPLGFELRVILYEADETRFVCLCNSDSEDPLAKNASSLTGKKLQFFKRVLNGILAHRGELEWSKAVNYRTGGKGAPLSVAVVEATLRLLEEQMWLQRYGRHKIVLGPRSYADLASVISESGRMVRCDFCGNQALLRVMCAEHRCDAVYHKRCAQKLTDGKLQCKKCGLAFKERAAKDMAAVADEEEKVVADDDDEPAEVGDRREGVRDPEAAPSEGGDSAEADSPPPARDRRRAANRKAEAEADDEEEEEVLADD